MHFRSVQKYRSFRQRSFAQGKGFGVVSFIQFDIVLCLHAYVCVCVSLSFFPSTFSLFFFSPPLNEHHMFEIEAFANFVFSIVFFFLLPLFNTESCTPESLINSWKNHRMKEKKFFFLFFLFFFTNANLTIARWFENLREGIVYQYCQLF